MLERYFRNRFIEEGTYTRIGGYWNRKGEDEIDIVAVNEMERRIDFVEVKRTADRINLGELKEKARHFLSATNEMYGFDVAYKGLSMEDM